MVLGIGVDLVRIDRFKMNNLDGFIKRYFNTKEIKNFDEQNFSAKIEYYASRFAAKEAFSKALGTGLKSFKLSDIYVENNSDGKPLIKLEASLQKKLESMFGKYNLNISITHEKEYAAAFVVIDC